MRSRALRISLLMLLTVWFGVVVPLHPRGIIKLPGACEGGRACCQGSKSSRHDESLPKPTSSDCAICYFVAALDLPPAIGMELPKLGLVEEAIATPQQVTPVIAQVDPISERGPPV